MEPAKKQIPFFFKRFKASDRTERLRLPRSWCSYMGNRIPCQALLRNRYGDSWAVKVSNDQSTDRFCFEEGWRSFVEYNKLAYRDHIVFKYDGKCTFDFKLFDEDDDEKEYVRLPNVKLESEEEEPQNMQHGPVVPEELQDTQLEPEELQDTQLEPQEQRDILLEPVASKTQPQLEAEPEERQDMQLEPVVAPEPEQVMQPEPVTELMNESEYSANDDDFEFSDELEERKTIPRKKAGQKRAPAISEADEESVFLSGAIPRPRNPYFVTKRRSTRNELYVPRNVVTDYNLRFPEQILIRDEMNGEWTATARKWKDGRIWISKGWKAFCKWNNVKRDDWCIIEIIKPTTQEAEIFLKARIVPAEALTVARS